MDDNIKWLSRCKIKSSIVEQSMPISPAQQSNHVKPLKIKKKAAFSDDLYSMAERRGFEPLHGFKTMTD